MCVLVDVVHGESGEGLAFGEVDVVVEGGVVVGHRVDVLVAHQVDVLPARKKRVETNQALGGRIYDVGCQILTLGVKF